MKIKILNLVLGALCLIVICAILGSAFRQSAQAQYVPPIGGGGTGATGPTGPTGATGGNGSAGATGATGGSYWAQLSHQVLGGTSTTVTFSGISGSYNSLVLRYSTRCSAAVSICSFSIQYNDDSTSGNYSGTRYIIAISGGVSTNTSAASSLGNFVNNVPGTSTTANYPAIGEIIIPAYAGTTFYKCFFHHGAYSQSGDLTDVIDTMGHWLNTGAITKIVLTMASSNNFVANSEFDLYGVN